HEFALRKWVLVRCERGAAPGRNAARWTDDAASIPLHDQATATVFGAGAMFPLFAAALRDWTVRKRYVVSQQILTQYGRPDFHEALLALLGCAGMPAARAEHHLAGMAAAFDAAASVVKTPYRFASDISPPARPISVDGTRELIERGLHREAVFWIAATHGRCRHIFSVDAPELLETFDPVYQELLDDLGIGSFEARKRRSEAVAAFQPRMWEVTQEILAKNAEIVD
ncbi:MAG TPA: hypothetical protein VFX49_17375, partial [Chloroflexota bacterium]|nr:hypothetical protein [Chloroflexota bacterium]